LFKFATFLTLTSTALDGSLNIIFGHILSPCTRNGEFQTDIRTWIPSPNPGSESNFSRQARKYLTTFGIGSTFLAPNCRPM
jgi:hypothetical protein